jgi:hypothetical protein
LPCVGKSTEKKSVLEIQDIDVNMWSVTIVAFCKYVNNIRLSQDWVNDGLTTMNLIAGIKHGIYWANEYILAPKVKLSAN